ncbi:hypothetical protein SOCE26_043430 [Sorangium cellulosum]|uniref:Secreted protein n=1 Tax=Sorangium cellulosum TaxID=56 RepID=A0A2L0EUF3_SORCE|nr:hypothetical protein [Sorangium cellulosum]AUX42905.1 hypothetical protein SOCE26_043430 [Sorangium cellulosum]
MRPIRHVLTTAVLALCLVGAAARAGAAPVAGHPRLWLTPDHLPRLRSWAADGNNRMYKDALLPALQRAIATYESRFFPNGRPNPTWPDGGTNAYVQYPTEAYAEFFAFMSLIDPVVAARPAHAVRARNLLMYAIEEAGKGRAENKPFRGPGFATGDRSRWWGEGFPLTLDWIYNTTDGQGRPVLSAADKEKIRKVFLRWTDENLHAATAGNEHPQPIGVVNDPVLVRDPDRLRWAANNFYLGHLRQVTLMSLSMDEADDRPLDPRSPPEALGNTLRSYRANATGAWLYQAYALFEAAEVAAKRLGAPPDGLGAASGGLPVEGLLYGGGIASLHQALLALHTAGYATPALSGPQIGLLRSGYWDRFTDGILHSLAPAPVTMASRPDLGPVYEVANYGDTMRAWFEPRFVDTFGSLGVYDYLTGNAARLQKSRWIVANAIEGGAPALYTRTSRVWASPVPSRAILSFMLFDPAAPPPPDPRPAMPTVFFERATGRGSVLARTDWAKDARWFTWRCGWVTINHQIGDCNQIGLYRKGEWLTKEHTSYSNNLIGATTDYHNTLSLQNDKPSRVRWYETEIVARGGQWREGRAAGDPTTRMSSGAGYVFAEGDATALYNTRPNAWTPADIASDIVHASRSAVWIMPDHVVVYDRAASRTAGRFKRFNLMTTAAPKIAGRTASVATPRGQALFVQSLLPRSAVLKATPAEDVEKAAEMEQTTHRLVVEDPAGPADVRFLHVLQGADGGARMDAAVYIESDQGAAFEGALVAGTAVLFRAAPQAHAGPLAYQVPGVARSHVITGLTPKAGYDVAAVVQGGKAQFRVTPGRTYTTDDAGVLAFRTP